jgi:hypothetical protein
VHEEHQDKSQTTPTPPRIAAFMVVELAQSRLNDNIGSIRVLEKLGMRQGAPDGNMLNWALSKEEWNAS